MTNFMADENKSNLSPIPDLEKRNGGGEGIYSTNLNAKLYSEWRVNFDEFFLSERHFFVSSEEWKNGSFLDVGGGCGGLGIALKKEFNIENFDYTNLDIDANAISLGRRIASWAHHIKGDLKSQDLKQKYDYVSLIGWFAQIVDWKEALGILLSKSRKYVNIGANVRLHGSTVIDSDVSYVYYLDSGKRVP